MPEPIVIIDTSDIREERLDVVRVAFTQLADFVREHEPRTAVYEVFLSADSARVTVLQVHPDAEAAEEHMEVAAAEFARFAELLTLRTIDIYGAPSETLLDRLRAKAKVLGAATLAVHERHAGFARLGTR